MILKYRVTLSGIKGFFRVYAVDANCTLYSFHKQMRADMEFPSDQPILFKALDAAGVVVARYALIDLGSGTVDRVSLKETVKAGVSSFVYFYDVTSRRSVILTFEGEVDEEAAGPTLIDSKGPNPIEFENGYVAYEDLPEEQKHRHRIKAEGDADAEEEEDDDEDDTDESEEEEDEKEELLYDSDENQ